ncbi:MAG TPA: bifunctional tetrahydrofolate synthase/dihydrofolate synthase [Luteimonas sp.]|nr:bifunctional tetrahydrofolate synthase/dihydrofolate synthase [Luteimonas sp.]
MKRSLEQWLDYQLLIHPKTIAMGLERVGAVAKRLHIGKPATHVITVAGTNGKGSTVAFIEAIARSEGLKVGAYTSPHLLRYNERVRIDGADADDAALIDAFERIEQARGADSADAIPLTYFEFGTLAALMLFEQAQLDLAILEVGLGGRLDATNIVDPDVAVVTTVDIDHQDYLGNDRESIGFEKAGILRAGKPAVFGEKDPPSSLLRRAYELGAVAIRGHSDYLIDQKEHGWRWHEPGYDLELPLPAVTAPAQLDNAAAAIAALRALPVEFSKAAIQRGIAAARVPGRLQTIQSDPEIVVDVGHNPQAARQLAEWLRRHPKPTRAVFSALADKDIEGIVGILVPHIEYWYLAGIDDAGPRGMTGEALSERLASMLPADRRRAHADVADALRSARAAVANCERVLVFGSFHTVAAALKAP